MSNFAVYWKGIVAALGLVLVAVQAALTDGNISSAEWVTIAITAVTAVGVFLKANKPAQ